MEPLLRAAPCTLRSLALGMPHLSSLPQLLALARSRFTALATLEVVSTNSMWHFGVAEKDVTQQQVAHVWRDIFLETTAMASTLTELQLQLQFTLLPPLAPLSALQRLRRLTVCGSHAKLLHPPPLDQFPCLEDYEFANILHVQVGAGVRA